MSNKTDEESKRPDRDSLLKRSVAAILVKLIPFFLIAIAVFVIVSLFLPIFGKPLIQLAGTDEQNASEIVLTETKDIFQLSSVEYMRKVVFPYDFLDENLSYEKVFDKLQAALPKVPQGDMSDADRIRTAVETYLTPAEQLFAITANLAHQSGLTTTGVTERQGNRGSKSTYDFLVATVVVHAGFDLAGSVFATDSDKKPSQEEIEKWIEVHQSSDEKTGKRKKSVTINLPAATILSTTIEDPIRDLYPFPDINLGPAGWAKIAGFIQDRSIPADEKTRVLDKARKNAAGFFTILLTQAGYDQVIVTSDGKEIQLP